MYSGVLPFFHVMTIFLAGSGFISFLHGHSWGLIVMVVGLVGFCVLFSFWVNTLYIDGEEEDLSISSSRDIKLKIGFRLGLLCFISLGVSFAMIPAYYWINGGSGHVHGSASMGYVDNSAKVMAEGGEVTFYLTKDINTDNLPVSFDIYPENSFRISPGGKASLKFKVDNLDDVDNTYTLAAKIAPTSAAKYIHFSLLHEPRYINFNGKGQKKFEIKLMVSKDIPSSYSVLTLATFMYGRSSKESWKKMHSKWPDNIIEDNRGYLEGLKK